MVDPSSPVITYDADARDSRRNNGWYRSDVTLTWSVIEDESPNSLVTTGCDDQVITTDQVATAYSCSAISAGGTAATVDTDPVKRDATAPFVTYSSASGDAALSAAAGTPGRSPPHSLRVTQHRGLFEPRAQPASGTEGAAVELDSPAFIDNAGNIAAAGSAQAGQFKIDLTDPTATFDSSLNGGYFYFGQVPSEPTCTASDAVSGPANCVVSGYGTGLGTHTLSATATDNAGRTGTATETYTVLAWTPKGFYQPVDMGSAVVNTVKGGSTVPLKFEVFAGSTELTSTSVVKSFMQTKVACETGASADEIEVTSTGGTSLRYDATGGQFVQNWQTPKAPGSCYRVTMTTQDGSTIQANFKLK